MFSSAKNTFIKLMIITIALMTSAVSAHESAEHRKHSRGYDTHIPFIVLNVQDLERSLDFYQGILGMKEVFRYDLGSGKTEVALGFKDVQIPTGAQIVLLHDANRTTVPTAGNIFNRYVIAVPDIFRAYDIATREGVTTLTQPTRYESFNATVFFARDPDGILIEILEWINVDRKKDPHDHSHHDRR